jgi:hypothetical protein
MNGNVPRTLLRAWLTLTIVDGIFATALPVVAYGQPFGRVWQFVASTLLGPSALQGGGRAIAVGLVMHAATALVWTTVFMALALLSPRLRRAAATPGGMLAAASVYGPLVWMVMSLLVIPRFTGRLPTLNGRWWVQLVAHVPFVALPIVATIGRGLRAMELVGPVRAMDGVA